MKKHFPFDRDVATEKIVQNTSQTHIHHQILSRHPLEVSMQLTPRDPPAPRQSPQNPRQPPQTPPTPIHPSYPSPTLRHPTQPPLTPTQPLQPPPTPRHSPQPLTTPNPIALNRDCPMNPLPIEGVPELAFHHLTRQKLLGSDRCQSG